MITTLEILIIFLIGMLFGAWGYKLFKSQDKGFKAGWDAAFIAISKITWHLTIKDEEEEEDSDDRLED